MNFDVELVEWSIIRDVYALILIVIFIGETNNLKNKYAASRDALFTYI